VRPQSGAGAFAILVKEDHARGFERGQVVRRWGQASVLQVGDDLARDDGPARKVRPDPSQLERERRDTAPAGSTLKPLVHGPAAIVDAGQARFLAVGERDQRSVSFAFSSSLATL
jgi:hypothetical protein